MAGKRKDKDEALTVESASSRVLASEAAGEDRVRNWAGDPTCAAYLKAEKLWDKVDRAFRNKEEQEVKIEEFWSIYNCIPDDNRGYIGNSECYLPVVRNCVKARVKRALKQLFSNPYRHVEAVSANNERPYPVLAMLEHYIRRTNLKNVVRADLTAGDVTGQWCMYVDWLSVKRKVRKPVRAPVMLEDAEVRAGQADPIEFDADPSDDEEGPDYELKVETIHEDMPDIRPLAVQDFAVIPPTANRFDPGVVSVVRMRMTRDKVEDMLREGVFDGLDADELMDHLGNDKGRDKKGGKSRVRDMGIKTEGTFKYALVFEAHCMLPLGDDEDELSPAWVYFAGGQIVGIIECPWWSGKRPVISSSIEEITGTFYGKSQIDPVKFLAWRLNDTWNLAMDSAVYSLLPIVMTDPAKQPNYQSMVIGLAAIWMADPNSTKFVNFPALYKEHLPLCGAIKAEIQESMDVNDAMLGRMPAGRKGSQQVAKQNADEATNINDLADRYEDRMLNPLLEMMFELDQQFRVRALTVEQRGDIGQRLKLVEVPPQQFEERYYFRWIGSDYANGMQRIQQQITALNVLRGLPPQLLNGRRLDVTPIIESMAEVLFGPEVAPHVLIDDRNLYTVSPDEENTMLHNGYPVEVHEADPDPAHIQAHQQAAVLTGDPSGLFRAHIAAHALQLQRKRQAQSAQQKGQPGVPGGAGPGVPGSPVPGSQPKGPQMRGPAGIVHQDQVADPAVGARP